MSNFFLEILALEQETISALKSKNISKAKEIKKQIDDLKKKKQLQSKKDELNANYEKAAEISNFDKCEKLMQEIDEVQRQLDQMVHHYIRPKFLFQQHFDMLEFNNNATFSF